MVIEIQKGKEKPKDVMLSEIFKIVLWFFGFLVLEAVFLFLALFNVIQGVARILTFVGIIVGFIIGFIIFGFVVYFKLSSKDIIRLPENYILSSGDCKKASEKILMFEKAFPIDPDAELSLSEETIQNVGINKKTPIYVRVVKHRYMPYYALIIMRADEVLVDKESGRKIPRFYSVITSMNVKQFDQAKIQEAINGLALESPVQEKTLKTVQELFKNISDLKSRARQSSNDDEDQGIELE